jgi:hypothetical protein
MCEVAKRGFRISALLGLAALNAAGAQSDLETSMAFTNSGSSAQTLVGTPAAQSTRFSETLRFSRDSLGRAGFWKTIGLSAGLVVSQPDYRSVTLTRKDFTTVPLSSLVPAQSEITGDLGVNYSINDTTFGISGGSSLVNAPYMNQSLGLSLLQGLNDRTTLLSLNGDLVFSRQPQDYFRDLDFRAVARPTFVHYNSVSGGVEQILTERWKVKATLTTAKREEERPRNFSGLIGTRVALTERLTAGLDFYHLFENEADVLRDPRGYLKITSGTLQLTWEIFYDLHVTGSYSLAVENESDPRRDFDAARGSDQFGLGVSYAARFGTVFAKGSYLTSATLDTQIQVTGGVAWKL